jgi:Na+/phosphate symporter
VRLYQDGLPVCGRELEIVLELAKAGSRNHQLLLRLKARGATLMGTELADLLVQEYHLSKQMLAANDSATARRWEARHEESSRSLLRRRDQAIAERINHTQCRGEIGLLFLGMLHSIERWLAQDIQVTHPFYRPSPEGHPCP